MLMLSPTWVFGVPALLALLVGAGLLGGAAVEYWHPGVAPQIGAYWTLLGSMLVSVGHLSLLLALAGHLYSIRAGYRVPTRVTRIAARIATLETMLGSGLGLLALGAGVLVAVAYGWAARNFQAAPSLLPAAVGTLAITLGMQNALGGFLMAIIGGHEARFFGDVPPDLNT